MPAASINKWSGLEVEGRKIHVPFGENVDSENVLSCGEMKLQKIMSDVPVVRGRHRRDGDRHGLSPRCGGEGDEGVGRAQLHPGEETEGTAELGGQTGRAASGVGESAAG
ncbi:MAG: hypothetical protein WB660_13840, partial [Candidatus Sulfotelmatobacter sp.]